MSKDTMGYVYILTNPSFREDWVKIGKSSRPVDIRSKELDNTAVPLPFEIFATMRTSKYNEVEKLVHKTIDRFTHLRIRPNREFFNVAPKEALDVFKDIATTIDDAEITEYDNNQPIDNDTGLSEIDDSTPKQDITDTGALQLEFWTEFNEESYENEEFSKNFSLRKASPKYWYDMSIGSSIYHICMTVSRQKREQTIGIYINNNKAQYHKMLAHKDFFKEKINTQIEWRESNKSCRFLIYNNFDIDNKVDWEKGFKWFYAMCVKLKKTMADFAELY